MQYPKFMIEKYSFIKCQNWNTNTCPKLHESQMQISIANAPHWVILNDDTPEPHILAQEIVENLGVALSEFQGICDELNGGTP